MAKELKSVNTSLKVELEYSFSSLSDILSFLDMNNVNRKDYNIVFGNNVKFTREVYHRGRGYKFVLGRQHFDEAKGKYVLNGTVRASFYRYHPSEGIVSMDKYFDEDGRPNDALFAQDYDLEEISGCETAFDEEWRDFTK